MYSRIVCGFAPMMRSGRSAGCAREEPHPEVHRERHVRAAEGIAGRHDVEHGELANASAMIERHTVGASGAAIVAHDGECVEAKLSHDVDLIARHRALRVRRVVRR